MMKILLPLLCGLSFIGLVVLFLAGVIFLIYKSRVNSRKLTAVNPVWPTVKGRVVASNVKEVARFRPEDDPLFAAILEYEYTVGYKLYKASQGVSRTFNLEFAAKGALKKYPPGTEVVVSYNPENPGDSRLVLK